MLRQASVTGHGMPEKSACIVVMGPYRSGTSLVARILSFLGVYLGPDQELFEASPYNPAGYYQRPDITEANTALIKSADGNLESPPDPVYIANNGDCTTIKRVDLAWSLDAPLWGMKDPRFCCTLYAWLQAGSLPVDRTVIVRVTRTIGTAAQSAIQHYDVKHFCGMNIVRASAMLRKYDALAAWHVNQLTTPSIEINYEQLIAEPANAIYNLAHFLGVTDPIKIQMAIETVGTGKSLVESER